MAGLSCRSHGRRCGVVLPLVATVLLVFIAAVALVIDVGKAMIAAGRAQTVADFAAMAGGAQLPSIISATIAAQKIIREYDTGAVGNLTTNIRIWTPGQTLPNGRTLGPSSLAFGVEARVKTPLVFARLFGMNWAQPLRRAIVVYGPVTGATLVPMWIPNAEYTRGQPLPFFYSPLNSAEDFIPGNFGWVDSPAPHIVSFIDLLSGENLTDQQREAAQVKVGDVLSGYTGASIGQTRRVLEGRIERASRPPYDRETFNNFSLTNPRVLVVPLVTYLGGTGTNARFRIERFAVTWLESVNFAGANSRIELRFVEYKMRARPDLEASSAGGLWAWGVIE